MPLPVMATTDLLDDPRRIRLVEWLCTPPAERVPDSQNKLAAELGVTPRAIRYWKMEPQLRAVWESQAKAVIGDPEKVQGLLQDLYDGARDANETLASRVRAADLWLRAVDAIKPPQADALAKKAAEMSDAELEAMIAQAAQVELSSRRDS